MEFQEWLARATVDITTHELYLNILHVDDNNLLMKELQPGTRLEDGKFVVKEDKEIEGDKRTALIMKELASNICF